MIANNDMKNSNKLYENKNGNNVINAIAQHIAAQPQPVIQQNIIPTHSRAGGCVALCNRCNCYNTASTDARCCGACYYCCPTKKKVEERCECCPNDFDTYWDSGYVQTNVGYGTEDPNGLCCWCCFPIKFPVFFTCFLGSLCNNYINWTRDTNLNYLF
uniref:Uncharacterized protein n=1 Tax=viral metagenome TaxID=1070528 RepID=A0A6C0IIN6_9ZZZZ